MTDDRTQENECAFTMQPLHVLRRMTMDELVNYRKNTAPSVAATKGLSAQNSAA